jgi:chromosome segregation ATPase
VKIANQEFKGFVNSVIELSSFLQVAKDMDQATRIAYGARRYRVVTLGGGIIEASGAMSGKRMAQS